MRKRPSASGSKGVHEPAVARFVGEDGQRRILAEERREGSSGYLEMASSAVVVIREGCRLCQSLKTGTPLSGPHASLLQCRHSPWAASSAGRAPGSQSGGREFEPRAVHQPHLQLRAAGVPSVSTLTTPSFTATRFCSPYWTSSGSISSRRDFQKPWMLPAKLAGRSARCRMARRPRRRRQRDSFALADIRAASRPSDHSRSTSLAMTNAGSVEKGTLKGGGAEPQ